MKDDHHNTSRPRAAVEPDDADFAAEQLEALDQLAAAGGLVDAFGRTHADPLVQRASPAGRQSAPPRRDAVLALLRAHAPELERRFGVRPVALFGSVARDEAHSDSDVDVLVEYVRPPGLREFMGAITYLEAVLDRRVDLGAFEDLKPRAAAYVARELVRVA